MRIPKITQAELCDRLNYDPETGDFTWRAPQSNRVAVSDKAGNIRNNGYWRLKVNCETFYAHRLAWFYVNGEWPAEIDHVNGDRLDNRIANLRACSRLQNAWNTGPHRNSASGLKGVRQNGRGLWYAGFNTAKQFTYVGSFKTKEAAAVAYDKAIAKARGQFARLSSGGHVIETDVPRNS